MARRLAAMAGLLAGLAPAMAHAQTNIDQGKTPAQIFANACAACHKATRGLASGKNRFTLTEFLREHYTTSREQAAGLAAYVLGAGFGESSGAATQGHGQRPAAERARAPTEEPKPVSEQAKPGKPEEETPATAKLQRPDEETKPEEESAPVEEPDATAPARRPAAGRHQQRPATTTATRSRRKQPETAAPAQEPAAIEAEPGSDEIPNSEASPTSSAAAPTVAEPGETTPVPRDNIPD